MSRKSINVSEGHHNTPRFDRKLFVKIPIRCLTSSFLVSEKIPGDDSDGYIEGGPDQPAFLVSRKIPSGPRVPLEDHHSLVEPFNTSSLATPDRGSGSNSSLIGVNLDLDDQCKF